MVEEQVEQETRMKQAAVGALFATCSSETSVDFQWTSRHYVPEDTTRHNHRCEHLGSYTLLFTIGLGLKRIDPYFQN
jgi:hypothetical protein